MRAGKLTTTAPDTRALHGRAGPDATPPDDGFHAALTGIALTGSKPSQAKAGGVPGTKGDAPAQTTKDGLASAAAGAGSVAVLLAKVANGMTPVASPAATPATDDPIATTPVATDPLAAITALLPGLVATPGPVILAPAAAAIAQATSTSSKLSSVLGSTSVLKDAKGPDAAAGNETADEAGVGLTLVTSSSHLAPAPSALASGPRVAGPPLAPVSAAKPDDAAVSKPVSAASAAAPSAPANAALQDTDATGITTTRWEPDAKLPNGTIQAIAGAVTSLAAETARSPATTAQSAAATPVPADPTPVQVAPARSLTLQLASGELGGVTVRLHLTAGGLDVHLAVDDHKTLAAISHARDDLATAIGDNGYRVESLVIRGADASSTSTAGSNDSARSQSEAGAGQGFSGGNSGGSDSDPSASRQRAPQPSPVSRDAGGDRGGDGVFV